MFNWPNIHLANPYASRYSALLWFFLIGFLAPIPFYFLARRFPFSIWRYVNIPALFSILDYMAQLSGINFSSSIICGFIFNYVIRRFRFKWWMRYNYILATALDAGTAISMVVIFFTLTLPKRGGIELNWWGNTWVSYPTLQLNWIIRLDLHQCVAKHSRREWHISQASTRIGIHWAHEMVLKPRYMIDDIYAYFECTYAPTNIYFVKWVSLVYSRYRHRSQIPLESGYVWVWSHSELVQSV